MSADEYNCIIIAASSQSSTYLEKKADGPSNLIKLRRSSEQRLLAFGAAHTRPRTPKLSIVVVVRTIPISSLL